ncbi:MAG: DUF748 domain-containing protein [Bacteroidales bacterium]|nr:DUF748 domain-containing protein [Bacteroidales bacterium]
MKKTFKIIGISLASLIGALLLLLLCFPGPLAKGFLHCYDEALTGRQAEIGKIKVNVLTGSLRIYDFHLKEKDAKTDFAAFDTLDVSLRLRKLLRSEVHIPHIWLSGLDVRIVQNDSDFNFSDLMERFASDTTDTSSSDWKIGIYDIRLAKGRLRYHDRARNKSWELNRLHLNVPGIYLDGKNSTDAGLSLAFADHGSLTTKVQYNMGSNDFEVRVDLRRFALENLKPYLTEQLRLSGISGDFNGNIHVKGNLDDILNLETDGTVSLEALRVTDAQGAPVVALQKLEAGIARINPKENTYIIDHILLDGFTSHYDSYANGQSNFSRLLPAETKPAEKQEEPAPAPSTPAKDTPPMQLLVKSLRVENTHFTYNDFTMEDAFCFPLTNIQIHADSLQLDGNNRMTVRAGLPGGGRALISWKGALDDLKTYQNLFVSIKNLNMKQLSPYVVHYLGYPLTDGVFSFTSQNILKHSLLEGENKLDIHKLSVGDKRSDANPEVHIPLKAAVYILNDKDDNIRLDIPVSGDIDNPEFSYMKIVWKTLANLLVKVSVSPLRYLADAVGINSDALEKMDIDPLQFDFTSEQYDFLSQLAGLAQTDTNILLQMEQQVDWEKAAHALSLYYVKRDYYLMQHPDKQGYRLQLVDFQKISAINVKDLDFTTYLDDKTGEAGSGKSVEAQAEILYPLSLTRKDAASVAERRNQYIRYYLIKQSGLRERQLEIRTVEENATENCYRIQSSLREE